MTTTGPRSRGRFERTVRTVMWLDAFLSVALVIVSVLAVPVVVTVGVPGALRSAVAGVAVVTAVLLAGFGAVTAVALMLRMSGGDFLLPPDLRLPLPPGMRPDLRHPLEGRDP